MSQLKINIRKTGMSSVEMLVFKMDTFHSYTKTSVIALFIIQLYIIVQAMSFQMMYNACIMMKYKQTSM